MSLKHPPKSLVGLDNRDKSDLFITFVLLPTPLKISSDWERQLALSISFFSVENIKKCPNQKYFQFLESVRKVEKVHDTFCSSEKWRIWKKIDQFIPSISVLQQNTFEIHWWLLYYSLWIWISWTIEWFFPRKIGSLRAKIKWRIHIFSATHLYRRRRPKTSVLGVFCM